LEEEEEAEEEEEEIPDSGPVGEYYNPVCFLAEERKCLD
jgi:hypothetical protein